MKIQIKDLTVIIKDGDNRYEKTMNGTVEVSFTEFFDIANKSLDYEHEENMANAEKNHSDFEPVK